MPCLPKMFGLMSLSQDRPEIPKPKVFLTEFKKV